MTTYPRRNDQGETVWACCESSIGPTCEHKRTPGRCASCNADISEYAEGIRLCVYCDPAIDTDA